MVLHIDRSAKIPGPDKKKKVQSFAAFVFHAGRIIRLPDFTVDQVPSLLESLKPIQSRQGGAMDSSRLRSPCPTRRPAALRACSPINWPWSVSFSFAAAHRVFGSVAARNCPTATSLSSPCPRWNNPHIRCVSSCIPLIWHARSGHPAGGKYTDPPYLPRTMSRRIRGYSVPRNRCINEWKFGDRRDYSMIPCYDRARLLKGKSVLMYFSKETDL